MYLYSWYVKQNYVILCVHSIFFKPNFYFVVVIAIFVKNEITFIEQVSRVKKSIEFRDGWCNLSANILPRVSNA